MTRSKVHKNIPLTELQNMEIYNLTEKFKRAIFKKLNELQENTERQSVKLRKTKHEQIEKFNKESKS